MPGYDYQGYIELGQGIGALFQAEHKKREMHRQMESAVDLAGKMPVDPTAPAGSPGSKPLLNAKQLEMARGLLQKNSAASDAALEAYMKIGEQVAYHGALTRFKSEQQQSQPTIVDTPQGQFFRGARGWQRIPTGGPTEGQRGVSDRFEKKELDRGITEIQKQLEAADISDPQFLLDSSRHKGGYMKGSDFVPSDDKKTHIQVETDDGTVNMPKKKFEHLKRKAVEWQDFKRQKTMPHADRTGDAGVNLPVLSPQEAAQASPGTIFRTLDGRIKKVPGGQQADTGSDDNGSDSGE